MATGPNNPQQNDNADFLNRIKNNELKQNTLSNNLGLPGNEGKLKKISKFDKRKAARKKEERKSNFYNNLLKKLKVSKVLKIGNNINTIYTQNIKQWTKNKYFKRIKKDAAAKILALRALKNLYIKRGRFDLFKIYQIKNLKRLLQMQNSRKQNNINPRRQISIPKNDNNNTINSRHYIK